MALKPASTDADLVMLSVSCSVTGVVQIPVVDVAESCNTTFPFEISVVPGK